MNPSMKDSGDSAQNWRPEIDRSRSRKEQEELFWQVIKMKSAFWVFRILPKLPSRMKNGPLNSKRSKIWRMI